MADPSIARGVEEARSSFCVLPGRADFEPCWPALRKRFGEARPAATMMEAGLSDPRMKIEIEVTARKR